MIRAEEYTFQYPTADEPALEDVSFAVEEGEVLGVVGPVEAGKTTLSKALSGFVPQITGGWYEGTLSVAGRDPHEADDTRVAMVFEDYSAQLTQLRVIDEVVAPLTNRGMDREQAIERARELLETVRLEEPEDKFTWELSGGQQQRLAIAAALAVDPDVLVFDTATDMLDPEGQRHVANLIASLAGEMTLVVAENEPEAVVGVADELLVLDDGTTVEYGPADRLLRDADLLESVGVAPPTSLRVNRRLGLDGTPLTPSEFRECLTDTTSAGTTGNEIGNDGVEPPMVVDGGAAEPPAVTARGGADSDGETVVDVDDATFEYPDGTVAVSDVDMTVAEGEVHAVLGGNGAGKSTLTKLLVALKSPTEGKITVDGHDTGDVTARDLAETVGIALQNPDEQISRETVEAELRYALEQRRVEKRGPLGLFGTRERYDESHVDERVETVREMVGLDEDVMDEDPAFLPRGEQRLVTIAAALAPDPEAVVLDEPAAGVDATAKATIRRAIDRLRAEGRAVVLVEHDMDFVCEVADTVTVLEDGDVAVQGPTEQVFDVQHWEWLTERYIRPPRAAQVGRHVGEQALTIDGLVDSLATRMEVQL